MGDFFKVVIIDDDNESVRELMDMFKGYSRFNIEGIAHDAMSGVNIINRVKPDLLFLDIELPEMYGMELLDMIKTDVKRDMRVVFYTAHDKYMINALRNYAFDFLHKPIDKKELEIIVSRFIADYGTKSVLEEKENIISLQHNDPVFMVLLPTGEMRMIKVSEVGLFRHSSDRKIWEAVLVTGENVALRRNVSADFLCAFYNKFVQVHQSYIVNMDFLLMIQGNNCILCPPFEEYTEVVVSRKYKKDLMDNFCIF